MNTAKTGKDLILKKTGASTTGGKLKWRSRPCGTRELCSTRKGGMRYSPCDTKDIVMKIQAM